MEIAQLVIGRTYFRLTFADRDLTMPGVEPLVYLGQAADEEGSTGFVFQDTATYVLHGSGLEGDEQHEDIVLYFMSLDDARSMSDLQALSADIAESAQRAASLEFPVLKPL